MRTLVPLALVLALTAHVSAEHCTQWSTSSPEVATPIIYVDIDLCPIDSACAWGIWTYEETNGVEGLQRGDEVVDDTCHGMIEPDTLTL